MSICVPDDKKNPETFRFPDFMDDRIFLLILIPALDLDIIN